MKPARNQQNEDNFKVAPVISDQKYDIFKSNVLATVFGLSILGNFDPHDQNQACKTKVMANLLCLLGPVLILIPSLVITDTTLHAVAVLIPVVFNTILAFLADIVLSKQKHIHKYIATAVYSYIWSDHFWIGRQLFANSIISGSTHIAIIILSVITVLTSNCTISFSPVRQFSASTFDYQQLNLHSTLYVRFYAALPIILTQLAIYYSPQGTITHPALPPLQFVASLLFVLWWFGWISSSYNNLMFIFNNLFNCLVFGEQLSHSGHNFRGNYSWWNTLFIFFANFIAIGVNIALVTSMSARGQDPSKIVQNQHVLLVCLAFLSSMVTTFVMYISYRCSEQKKSLIRLNKFDLTQMQDQTNNKDKRKVYKGRFFIGHKQTLMLLTNLLIPMSISILAVFVFAQYYDGYGNGRVIQKQTNFYSQKLTTWILLAVNVLCYITFVIFKQITRVRSKVGCSINPCCFNQFYAEVERDLYSKIVLKFTGALSIMALVLRIQHTKIFSSYIMSQTPISPLPHPQVQFFIQNILLPILIYRSYKRSQTFSHFFHISIIVALILTLVQSTQYFYQSILVVLAFPNFPENPFRLLLLSPFTVPDKLLHKNQCCYRIGYLLVNFFTLIFYIVSLGTFQFTMIFGLPVYWCVIPSINCQMPKIRKNITINEKDSQNKISDLEMSDQNFGLSTQVNRSTPQHNLYQKIVSEIPFYIFRNKRPGYYLLRINKYILLVEVIMDYYGIFQTVNLIGLQTQQVTTCHAKQGETIDRIVDYNWGSNPHGIETWACDDALKNVIHEEHRVRKVKITSQNQIQLTGIIQSPEFFQLFKKCLIRSIVYNYNKLLKKSPKISLTNEQIKQAEVLLDDLQGRTTKQKIDQFFPYDFVNQADKRLLFSMKFKQFSPSKMLIKKKLPPLNKKQGKGGKKQQIIDDFADLIGGASSNTGTFLNPNTAQAQKINIDHLSEQSVIKQNNADEGKKDSADLNSAIIVSAYLSIIGKINYFNPQRIYKIMKKEPQALSQFEFTGGLDLSSVSIGCALKIAIRKQLEGEDQISFEDYLQYDKNQFMGTLQSPEFSQAIEAHKQDIWTVSYNQAKRVLSVKRLAKNETPLYLFSFETHAVQAVWNNLRFQLLYAANDNDERYSIQTHQYLLRNLLVEACQQPYGYAGYYSQQFLNL